jgi:hypothetical protein
MSKLIDMRCWQPVLHTFRFGVPDTSLVPVASAFRVHPPLIEDSVVWSILILRLR